MNIYYWGADKFLARPGRKQATATEGFEFHISSIMYKTPTHALFHSTL